MESLEVDDADDMLVQLTAIKDNVINRALALTADWLVDPDIEHKQVEVPLGNHATQLIDGFINDFITLNQKVKAANELKASEVDEPVRGTSSSARKCPAGDATCPVIMSCHGCTKMRSMNRCY